MFGGHVIDAVGMFDGRGFTSRVNAPEPDNDSAVEKIAEQEGADYEAEYQQRIGHVRFSFGDPAVFSTYGDRAGPGRQGPVTVNSLSERVAGVKLRQIGPRRDCHGRFGLPRNDI